MPYNELHSAAARIVSVANPTDVDVHKLSQEFHLHPVDAEAILCAPMQPRVEKYGAYLSVILRWPSWNHVTERFEAVNLALFIHPQYLVIVSDATVPIIKEFLQPIRREQNGWLAQADGPTLAYELLLALTKQTVAEFDQMPAGAKSHRYQLGSLKFSLEQLLDHLSRVQRQLPGLLADQSNSEITDGFRLVYHHLHHLLTEVGNRKILSIQTPAAATPLVMPRAVKRYAWASATMLVLVVIAISAL